MADLRVSVEGDKYIFGVDERTGRVYALRFGEEWISKFEKGGKALIALIHEFHRATASLVRTRADVAVLRAERDEQTLRANNLAADLAMANAEVNRLRAMTRPKG